MVSELSLDPSLALVVTGVIGMGIIVRQTIRQRAQGGRTPDVDGAVEAYELRMMRDLIRLEDLAIDKPASRSDDETGDPQGARTEDR